MEQQEEYWRDQIRFAQDSGVTMKAWYQQHQVTLGQMKYWLRKLGLSQRRPKASATWVEVPLAATSTPSLVVGVGNVRIEVAAGFDPMLLEQIVQT